MQPRRSSRAIIVHVVNRNLRHAELIEHPLPAGAVAVAVAGDALVDVIVVNLGVEEGFDAGFEAEFGVVDLSAGFDEFGHANAQDVGGGWGGFAHGRGMLEVWGWVIGFLSGPAKESH